jgi:hypothetical protein
MIPMPYYGDTPDESPVSVRDEFEYREHLALDAEDEAEFCDPNDHALKEELWFYAYLKWTKCDPCQPSEVRRVARHTQKCFTNYKLAEASALLEILQ